MNEFNYQGLTDEAEWSWLKAHQERGALFIVSISLNLNEVVTAIATDQKVQVAQWLQSGNLARPHAEQLLAWDATPTRRFLTAIVQPYVLIQERFQN